MRRLFFYTNIILLLACVLAGCQSQPHDVMATDKLPDIYPDYVDVTVPVGIAPLDFAMTDDDVTVMDVVINGSKTGSIHANGEYADFDIDDWHCLLLQNKGGHLKVTVCAEKNGQWTQYRDFLIHVSNHPMDAWGVIYRRIPPSYMVYGKMGIYQRDLSSFDETPIIETTQIPGMCVNCHTPNRTNPDQYVFHVRGEKGATFINTGGDGMLLQAKNEVLGGSMVYPYWHPGGRYCAFSTNSTSQMFHLAGKKRIEVYDSSSDIFVYDTQARQTIRDTLVMKKYWAENCPVFSPDGKWLYFITAKRQVYPTDYDKERYDLCRVAFDEKTGRIGATVDTLIHASREEKSVTWPRPSYDGKYIMYTRADYGYFSIWHDESDLWILDLETGETRSIDEVNSGRAESFHNWTANSRWFLFTSRRDDGLYTRLYFSCIDDAGRATKPFMLPQRDPKTFYRRLMYSYNTPDFATRAVNLDSRKFSMRVESGVREK